MSSLLYLTEEGQIKPKKKVNTQERTASCPPGHAFPACVSSHQHAISAKTLNDPGSPPGPSPTWVWGSLGISLARRKSRQQEKERQERTENRVLKGIITNAASVYSGHARNQQLLVNLHLISAAGLEKDALPSNVRGVRREVGPLVMKRVAASGPTGSLVSGCCSTGRRHAA